MAIAVRVAGAAGPAVFEETDERRSQDAEGGVHRYTVQVPLADIPPGDYVRTVEAASGAAGGRTVQRRVPISIDR